MFPELEQICTRARRAARQLRVVTTGAKNQALEVIADEIIARTPDILAENAKDLEAGEASGLASALLERLMLSEGRLASIAADVRSVAALPDPVGETFDARALPNGLRVSRRRVPMGVIGVIYESRPNVTVDISALCLKSGNVAILRGGKEAVHSNRALADAVSAGCARAGIPEAAVQLVRSLDRAVVGEMITANAYIDMIIPRGGTGLQRFCVENATIPVITGGIGICHAYVDESADRAKTPPMIVNAKVQRPTVCNALDVVLIHQAAAAELLPAIADALAPHGVELRCDPIAYAILEGKPGAARLGPEDYDTEFLSLRLAIHVVEGLDEALDHIHEHSTHHSDLIITESYSNANRFVDEVDSAAVFVNASTRFNDGAQLGLGAEVAISTQRLHARGPMALRELTTYKWVVLGDGQIRG